MIIDFASRFKNAFGYMSNNVSRNLKNFGLMDDGVDDMATVMLLDKDSVFDEVKLIGNDVELLFAFRSIVDTDEYKDIFATPPLLSLKRAKKLTITPIDNSDIEVIERYATEPWQIEWRGLLIDMDNHNFPIDKMKQLNEVFEINDVWGVESEILQAVGVQSVYFCDISFEFVEGYEDTIAYTFTSRAIKPLEYQLINE